VIMGKRYTPPVCEVVVRPAGAAVETKLVLLVALLTVVVCGSAIALRRAPSENATSPDWQVDAFRDLRAGELAVFNNLYTAAPEIEMSHEFDGGWPSVDQLATSLVPPFVRDAAWEKDGAMSWSRSIIDSRDKHIALYLGHPGKGAQSGSFLLIMLHDHVKKEGNAGADAHAPYEIWRHVSPVASAPEMITDQALINKGWRQVVARRGEQETRRAKGGGAR